MSITATATPANTQFRPLKPLPSPPSRPYTILQAQGGSHETKKPTGGSGKVTKRRNSNATSSEKKEARKIAHSDIERRRRLKINEQFDQLRSLVPACTQFKDASGGDSGLHKLEILEHTVKYIEHLHTCLDLTNDQEEEQNYTYKKKRMSIDNLLC